MPTSVHRAGENWHVSLKIGTSTYGFILYPNITGWRRLDISDFAPRVSAGALSYRDLSIWQTWAQDDWRHGFGQAYFIDESGYMKTDNGVDTRHKGIVMMATTPTSSETGHTVVKFVDFASKVYAIKNGNAGVRVYDPTAGTWAATAQTTGTCLDAVAIGTYLVVSLDGASTRLRKFDGSNWSDAGNAGNPPNHINKLCLHGGYLWASEHDSNYLHYDSEDDISTLEGGEGADTDAIKVGPGDIPIVNMISYAGQLYVAREDGIWVIADDNTSRLLLDFSRERHADNFQSMAVWKGHLFFTVRQNIYRYTGSTLMDITPPRYSETYPYYTYGDFQDMVPRGPWLYVRARDSETTFHECILAFDGTGWHKLHSITTSPYIMNSMGYSTTTDRMWLNYTGASTTTAYIPFQSLSDLPYASFSTTTTTASFTTSKFDAGFIDVIKVFSSLRVRSNNCSSTKYISVDYSVDDGSWVNLGNVTTSPYQLINFPDPTAATTYGKTLQLRFTFHTASATSSPILESFAVNYLLRPTAVWGWQLNLCLADNIRTLEQEIEQQITSEEQMTALATARDQYTPVVFTDPWGTSHNVYMSSVQMRGVEWRPGVDMDPEMIANVSLTAA